MQIEVLPNFNLPPGSRTGPEAGRGLIFIGRFWHPRMGDAVRWFVESILPSIRGEAPDVVFSIAGANPDDDVLSLPNRAGIEVLGYVSDLGPLFDSHRVFAALLRYGASMKGKAGQSLLYSLLVVTTPIGTEGMDLEGRP